MDQYSLEDTDLQIRLRGAWEQVVRRLANELSPHWMERFIKPLTPTGFRDGVVIFAVPGRFVHEWVRQKYYATLCEMLSDELGESVTLEFQVEPRDRAPMTPLQAAVAQVSPHDSPTLKLHDKYMFETFVVGQSNRMAFAGAKAVAQDPGSKYNPLFIYGSSGLGKTHLLHSIARTLLDRDPHFPLVYISAQQFAEQFVYALQSNRIEQFRRAQRNVGVWLIDDIQFIAGKDKTQEEVFHTFNYLYSLGKQIVLTSDRPPQNLYLMDDRLRSRFEAGLVADIHPPDTETRCAIVQSKARQEGLHVDHEIAMFLAENVPGNIRVLEGALTKLAVIASLDGSVITPELAARVVEQNYRGRLVIKPDFQLIVDTVSRHFKVSVDEIVGPSRKGPIVNARHIAVFITRELTGDSWKHIGSLFGDRDHTSVMHGYQKISEGMIRDKELRATVKGLIRSLYPEQ